MPSIQTPPDIEDVVIVGAGLSGLCTAHALRKTGIKAVILEMERSIAEPWRRRHPQLRLNTHRWLSSLPGYRMPAKGGGFPSRDEVVSYLERYAAETEADIRFGTVLRRLVRTGDHWELDTSAGRLAARHVVIATGKEREPHVPAWPGSHSWRGRLIHSAALGDITRYRNRKVLVVGAGNSGTDVLNHLAGIRTKSLYVSVRNGSVFLPSRLLGFPVQLASPLMNLMPLPLVDRMLSVSERLSFGDLGRFGIPKRDGAASRLAKEGVSPAIDNGFIAALKAGRATIVDEIDRFDETGVVLKDGTRLEPDVVIAATGYGTGLEPVVGATGALDARGMPKTDDNGEALDAPGLWFVGMRPKMTGYFHTACKSSGPTALAIRKALDSSPAPATPDLRTGTPDIVLHPAE
jgi:cation diffusion facilitator CzcD-associated flavoprotein CzcO